MAKTYEYEPSNIIYFGKDRMRFELGDTLVEGKEETSALTDEEIEAILEIYQDSWKRAKLALLENIFRRFAYEPDTKTGPLSFAFEGRAKLWRDDYERLKKEMKVLSIAIPNGLSGKDKKPPCFYTGMQRNGGAR